MFDLGMQELIIIFVVALIVFGPKKLPELARMLGKGMGELKRAMHGIKDTLEEADIRDSVRDKVADFTLSPPPETMNNNHENQKDRKKEKRNIPQETEESEIEAERLADLALIDIEEREEIDEQGKKKESEQFSFLTGDKEHDKGQ